MLQVVLVARWLRVPILGLSDIFNLANDEWVVLGALPADLQVLQAQKWFPGEMEADAIAERVDTGSRPCLIRDDLRKIAKTIPVAQLKTPTKAERITFALRNLGGPAHYSEVADEYNRLFPGDPMSEHNVHAVLTRGGYHIVWIGVKGMYALKEWGYERPAKGLFEAVAEIVSRKYGETGKPVPFEVITAEMGRYRTIVKPTSITLATCFNEAVRRADKNSFVPQEAGGELGDSSNDDLDRVLRELERRVGKQTGGSSSPES